MHTSSKTRCHRNIRHAKLSDYTTSPMRAPWRLLVGALCIALILVSGTLSVSHSHPDGNVHSDCSLCVTAHAAVQISVPPAEIAVVCVFIAVETPESIARPQSNLQFALFSRPPPADSNRS